MEEPNVRENIGKSLLDIAKLTFASFILGGILRGELPQFILMLKTGAAEILTPHK